MSAASTAVERASPTRWRSRSPLGIRRAAWWRLGPTDNGRLTRVTSTPEKTKAACGGRFAWVASGSRKETCHRRCPSSRRTRQDTSLRAYPQTVDGSYTRPKLMHMSGSRDLRPLIHDRPSRWIQVHHSQNNRRRLQRGYGNHVKIPPRRRARRGQLSGARVNCHSGRGPRPMGGSRWRRRHHHGRHDIHGQPCSAASSVHEMHSHPNRSRSDGRQRSPQESPMGHPGRKTTKLARSQLCPSGQHPDALGQNLREKHYGTTAPTTKRGHSSTGGPLHDRHGRPSRHGQAATVAPPRRSWTADHWPSRGGGRAEPVGRRAAARPAS